MAIRSTDQFATETEAPEAFVPNLQLLQQGLQSFQTQFDTLNDTAANIKINALQPDRMRANEIVSSLQKQADDVATTFTDEGVLAGMKELKQTRRDIQSAFKPGGEAAAIEGNFAAAMEYNKRLDKMFDDGDIANADKLAWLKQQSMTNFAAKGGTNFNAAGNNYNSYSGIQAAKDVDVAKLALERVEKWKADKEATGEFTRVPGGYIETGTKTFVSESEVFNHVLKSLPSDPTVSAFLNQEADRHGKQGNDKIAYISESLNSAASLAAASAGFEQYDPKYLKDNYALQSHSARQQMKVAKFKHDLENQAAIINTWGEANNIKSPTGTSYKDVAVNRDNAQTAMIGAVNDLRAKMGEENYRQMLMDNGLSVDAHATTIRKALNDGTIDPTKYSGVSSGIVGNVIQALDDNHRQFEIANNRIVEAQERVKKLNPEAYEKYYAKRPDGAIKDLAGLASDRFGTNVTPELLEKAIAGKDNKAIMEITGEDNALAASEAITQLKTLLQDKAPDKYNLVSDWGSDIASFRNEVMGELDRQLNHSISQQYQSSTKYVGVSDDDLPRHQKALGDHFNADANKTRLIEQSAFSPEQKNEIAEARADGWEVKFSKVPRQVQGSLGGKMFWEVDVILEKDGETKPYNQMRVSSDYVNTPEVQELTSSPEFKVSSYIDDFNTSGLSSLSIPGMYGTNIVGYNKGTDAVKILNQNGQTKVVTKQELINSYANQQKVNGIQKKHNLSFDDIGLANELVNDLGAENQSPTETINQLTQTIKDRNGNPISEARASALYEELSGLNVTGTDTQMDPNIHRR